MSTQRQKLAASKLVEFGGNMGKAMVAAGYSPATAKTPQKLTARKGWGELMAKMFNDVEVRTQHAFLIDQFDNLSVKAKAIDMYYKVTGKYSVNPVNNEEQAKMDQLRQDLKDLIGAK